MGKLKWKTIEKLNVKRTDHTWKIRLVGKPEFDYLAQLINGLDAGKFTYRITNHTQRYYTVDDVRRNLRHNWVVAPDCVNPNPFLIDEPGVTVWKDYYGTYVVNINTGEIYADRGDVITIMVYKNTTQLELVNR